MDVGEQGGGVGETAAAAQGKRNLFHDDNHADTRQHAFDNGHGDVFGKAAGADEAEQKLDGAGD